MCDNDSNIIHVDIKMRKSWHLQFTWHEYRSGMVFYLNAVAGDIAVNL